MSQDAAVDPLFIPFQLALAGRYSIDSELGRGGMGIVYLAREVHLDRLVAIKLLPPGRAAQPSLRERFLREARLAAKLSHPNIIPIHAVEATGGFVYYVMAYVDGETLAERVRARGPLSSSEGARVLREVAWALAYAHGQGLVHRDVKPDNILLEGATNRVLVADFGIAAAFGDAAEISGTPEFMSPEQALGRTLDARSDLYGLGATAFYAFTGRHPFEGGSATEVLAKQVMEPAPPLASVGISVPRKLASLVDRCLAKEPHQRPESAHALAEQLSVAIEKRRDLPAALRGFAKRNGRLNGGGTLIVGFLLLPVSTAVSAWFGGFAGFTTFLLGSTVFPFGYLTVQARRLMLQGFAHSDLEPAFKSEIDQSREELALERPRARERLEKFLRFTAKASVLTVLAALGFNAAVRFHVLPEFSWPATLYLTVPLLIFMPTVALASAIGMLAIGQRTRDVDTEFWSKLWSGRLGRAMFAVAKRFLGKRTRQSAMTHRATELSLGMAAEQLFDSLPKDTRVALGDLPAVLRRLQDDAQLLRKRSDDVQEALASAGDGASAMEYAEVRALRDELRAKLGEAVGALETIRLNLLRLHAGAATVQGLTTHLGLAAEVSEQVERLIGAHADVDRLLSFPRYSTPTPV